MHMKDFSSGSLIRSINMELPPSIGETILGEIHPLTAVMQHGGEIGAVGWVTMGSTTMLEEVGSIPARPSQDNWIDSII